MTPLTRLLAVQHHVPQCLSLSLVDLEEGSHISTAPESTHDSTLPQNPISDSKLPLSALVDAFFASAPPVEPGTAGPNEIQDVVVQSGSHVHVFCRSVKHPSRVLHTVCQASAGIGPILVGCRQALQALQRPD